MLKEYIKYCGIEFNLFSLIITAVINTTYCEWGIIFLRPTEKYTDLVNTVCDKLQR